MNYNMLIVEGSDCAGKSSLIEELQEHFKYQVVKGSSFELSQCNHNELLNKFTEMTKLENVIFDRFIYSNEVYASLYDDYSILTHNERRYLENEIKHKALVIYLYADLDILTKRLLSRGDDYVSVDKLEAIKSKYTESMNYIYEDDYLPVISVNTSNKSKQEVFDEVINSINELNKWNDLFS